MCSDVVIQKSQCLSNGWDIWPKITLLWLDICSDVVIHKSQCLSNGWDIWPKITLLWLDIMSNQNALTVGKRKFSFMMLKFPTAQCGTVWCVDNLKTFLTTLLEYFIRTTALLKYFNCLAEGQLCYKEALHKLTCIFDMITMVVSTFCSYPIPVS